MIFVDTNVIMYAVGREHPLRKPAQKFFESAMSRTKPEQRLVASAEVLQELLHAYLPVQRVQALDAALHLVSTFVSDVWAVEAADVALARELVSAYPSLDARDLLHLACCKRRDVSRIKTYDRALAAAFAGA
jgi:predicted nucleic acid-binding protein